MVKYNQEDLRSHYGVGAIIKNENDEILMLKHNKFNLWTIPIGKVDFGEDIFEGMNRELQEELNIKAKEMKDLISGDYYYKRDGIRVKVEIHIFEVLSYTGKPRNNEPHKHSDMKWMSLDDVQKLKQRSDATALYLSYVEKTSKRNMIRSSLNNILKSIDKLLESTNQKDFKTPEDLLSWMSKNIEYGWVDNNGVKQYGFDTFYNNYRLQSPQDVLKSKIGICWDQVFFQKFILNQMNINNKIFYIERNNKENDTHTFLMFTRNKKDYWFENSFEILRGTHGPYNNTQQPVDIIIKAMRKHGNDDGYALYEIKDTPRFDIGCQEFMDFAKEGKLIKEI